MKLQGKTAIITGAAKGIGAAAARRFAAEGARIVLADKDEANGHEVAKAIVKEGGEAAFCLCDVGNEADVQAALDTAARTYGKLDIVVNNAGWQLNKTLLETTPEEFNAVLNTNLTSMFLFGSNQPSPALNYRPALHDSNGLSILAGNGEWIWRPLNNPKHLAVSSYAMENPQGFGLLQRGRQFSRFEDLDDRYDLRPSAWITPKGEWGKGKIELVEIPTNDETNDNIVTYWTPDQLPEPGKEMNFKYTITFSRDEDKLHAPDNAYAMQTRRSTGDVKQSNLIRQPDGTIAFIVDFTGADMKKLPADTPVAAQASTGDNAEIVENTVRYNPVTKGWRMILRLKVKDPKKTTEMRAALVNGDDTLSETWSYQLPANE